ncbi:MAG: hypothetical protein IBX68_03430 [Dehalococcoidia bacterium]|nr:hypothetical protein [Dehalococcoidia bacterium]
MATIRKYVPLSRIVMIMAFSAIVMGSVFIAQGVVKAGWISEAMRVEQVTLGLSEEAIARGEIIDSAGKAQEAGDVIREHRRNIAASYEELIEESGRFDPTNPRHLSYGQALNMENYLYMAVLGFGVTQMAIASGAFMIFTGLGLGAASIALRKRKAPAA